MNAKLSVKTVYSMRIRAELKKRGIEPLVQLDNTYKEGYKCWIYEETEEFIEAFDNILASLGYKKDKGGHA